VLYEAGLLLCLQADRARERAARALD
jgi:hypothetical protein